MLRSFLLLVLSSLFLGGLLRAAEAQPEKPATEDETRWTPDDILLTESAGGMQLSPDGKWVVWVKTRQDKEHGSLSHLYRTNLAAGTETQLTRGTVSCANPRWSPDGKHLAFVTARPAPDAKPPAKPGDGPKPQLWLLDPTGGEPWKLTDHSRGVTTYQWADSDTLVYAAQEEPTHFETDTKEEKKDTSLVVDDEGHAPPARLFKTAIKTKKATRLTDNADRIQSFALSPDGRKAVTLHDRSLRYVYDQRLPPIAFLYDLETGQRKPILEGLRVGFFQVFWTADGKGFYAATTTSSHPIYSMASVGELHHYDVVSGKTTKVNLEWDRGLAGAFRVTGDGFLVLLADGARHRLARYTRTGETWKRAWIEGADATTIYGLELSKDGQVILYSHSTASTPWQLFHARLAGDRIESPKPFTKLNPAFVKKPAAQTEVIRWKGALDEEVEGILYYPLGYQPGKKYPLVVMIHGGPAGADHDAWADSWAYPHHVIAQRGAFVFKPNYHGSSDYGLKWVESIGGGRYYDLEIPDIEKGVDSLIAKGLVDPDKLGVMGWSNGSILSIALTTQTTRYKAASTGAGDVDWVSDWGNCEFGASFDNYYLGKSPLEDRQVYLDKSPFYKLDRVRTPTIIYFGTEDRAVPTQQGWMHYRALQQLGKADVRFVLFPGEPHGLGKLVHQKRKMEEDLAWLDRYLFATAKPSNEAFKAGSPLAGVLKRQSFARAGANFGKIEKGLLVPETVAHAHLEVGRFEVTCAQFAQFEKSYPVVPGKENFPASAISFEKAQAYCAWLSQQTGQPFRLPTVQEAEKLAEAAGKTENTLDYWAGYSVNPDDAARLRDKLKELDHPGALLKEVGSFPGAGKEEPVFDLGGNVAEWAIDKDGKGIPCGGSADTPADAKLKARQPAPEYIGLRVVKGLASDKPVKTANDALKEPLWNAAKKGDAARVKELLDQGADVNAATEYGVTALHYAAEHSHLAVVRVLLEHKAELNKADQFYSQTPLGWALYRKQPDIVVALIDAGATGTSEALTWAVAENRTSVVESLLRSGKLSPESLSKGLAAVPPGKVEMAELLKKSGARLAPVIEGAKVDLETLKSYAGTYRSDNGHDVTLKVVDGCLLASFGDPSTTRLVAVDATTFKAAEDAEVTVVFQRKENAVWGLSLKSGSAERTYERAKKPADAVLPKVDDTPAVVKSPGNWPSFRGAHAAGVADGQAPPTLWDAEKGSNVRWKTAIPGLGHSCPIVWGDRVFLTSAVGSANAEFKAGLYGDYDSAKDDTEHRWQVLCLDKKTGKVIWDQTACRGLPKTRRHLKSSQANPTPATDGKHLVAFFGSEGLYCYDLDGKLLWKNDLGVLSSAWFFDADYQWGFGSSPVIFRDLVFVQCDVGKGSFLAAFRVADGKEAWRTPREEIPSWGTPTVVEGPTRTEIVTNATKFARGYDPLTGKELWRLGRHSEVTTPTPIYGQGLIFITSGYRPVQPIYAVKPGANGDISLAKDQTSSDAVAWSLSKGGPYMPTPIVYGDYLYICANAGMVTCYEARTGKQVYKERLGGTGGYTASPVAADGKLYFTSEESGVRVVKAGPQFELLAVNPMGEVCMATPAIADGMLFVRTQHHLYGIGRTDAANAVPRSAETRPQP